MKEIKKTPIAFVAVMVAILLVLAAAGAFDWNKINTYEMYNTDAITYAKAKVISVDAENLVKDQMDESRYLGTQDLTVEILEGQFEGQEVIISNNLSRTLNVYLREGQKAIVRVDAPLNTEPYFSIYSYNRESSIVLVAALFIAAMILIGGKKGFRAVLGLALTMGYIFFLLVPAIYHGFSVLMVTILVMLAVTAASLLLLNGSHQKTILSIAATLSGILIAGIACLFCQWIFQVSGYNTEDMEALVLVSQNTGLEIRNLLFASVLISSLGAVMDVAVSVVAALWEIYEVNPERSARQLFVSGMNMGKDMIGTMSNTLILAFTGTALTTFFLLMAYGYQSEQLLNSDYLALELVQAVSSTFAVILTVPTASLISAVGIKSLSKQKVSHI